MRREKSVESRNKSLLVGKHLIIINVKSVNKLMPSGRAQFVHKDFMTSPLSRELYNNYAITF